jgi:hypothetical protein
MVCVMWLAPLVLPWRVSALVGRSVGTGLAPVREGARWILENQAGRPSFLAMRRAGAQHKIERVGRQLRAMMPWLNPTEQTSQNPDAEVRVGAKK